MPDKRSELQEVKMIGFEPTKNSGRSKTEKGDAILKINGDNAFTLDVKEYAKSYSVSIANWSKICEDALQNQSSPLLKIVLGSQEPRTRLVVMDESIFKMLLNYYLEDASE